LFTVPEITEVHLGYREAAYKFNDEVTRKSGKLAKQIILFDMAGTSLSSMLDRSQADIHSSVSKICASVYPQLQDAMVLVRASCQVVFTLQKCVCVRAFSEHARSL